jgi:hypothetical protein
LQTVLRIFFLLFITTSFVKAEFYISAGIGSGVKYNSPQILQPNSPVAETPKNIIARPHRPDVPSSENITLGLPGCSNGDCQKWGQKKETISSETRYDIILKEITSSVNSSSIQEILSSYLGSIGYKFKLFRFEVEGKNTKTRQNIVIDNSYLTNYDVYSTTDTTHYFEEKCNGSNTSGASSCLNNPFNFLNCIGGSGNNALWDNEWHYCKTTVDKGEQEYFDSITKSQSYYINETILSNIGLGFFNILTDIPIIQNGSLNKLPITPKFINFSIFAGLGVGYAISKYSSTGNYNETFKSMAYQGKAGAYITVLNNIDLVAAYSAVFFNKEPLKDTRLQQVELSLRYNFKSFGASVGSSTSSSSRLNRNNVLESSNTDTNPPKTSERETSENSSPTSKFLKKKK